MGSGASQAVGGILGSITGGSGEPDAGGLRRGRPGRGCHRPDAHGRVRQVHPQLAEAVRRNVVSRVESLVGLRVTEVNITVPMCSSRSRRQSSSASRSSSSNAGSRRRRNSSGSSSTCARRKEKLTLAGELPLARAVQAALATEGVHSMGRGRYVEAATYEGDEKVTGVVVNPDGVEIHIVARYPLPSPYPR